ncbi:M56 family metallopeptidase [Clostridium intestinale]|uniref:Signal transducer regulating beta-lactamase production, contains metallopeptidase domain n=1 Tax=Clostridium intestinale DSM 6191 TaxID=1121320 RepID=A0A1M5WEM0_9CLOT|nr:M56 family metallopeptidase [Clostridium intestinale]SHH85673.1 Signal transducer regulating beta-lactamase production, contains metallopeptidase domain [Clostridium intestinale DSM 6191]
MREVFLEVLRTSLLVSILIAGIIVTKDKFLSKYSHKFNYLLSLIVITRMLLLINIKLKVNIADFTKKSYTAYHEVIYNLTEAPVKNINTIDYTYIGMWVWIIGLVAVLLYYTYFQGKFYSKIKNNMASVTDKRIEGILNEERKALSITKDIKVEVVNGLSSPALIGLFRATIILPKQDFSNKELSLIFRHELIHFKRKDNITKLLMILGTAIYWFNPLIYLFRKFFNEQCELSCDEKVIHDSKTEDIKEYSMLLVKSARYKNTLKLSIMSSQLTNKKVNITKRRVENMLNLRSKKKGIVAGVVTLTVIGGTLFTLNTNKVLAVTNDETSNSQITNIENQEELVESYVNINGERPLIHYVTYASEESIKGFIKGLEKNIKAYDGKSEYILQDKVTISHKDGVEVKTVTPRGAILKMEVETGKILWYTAENEVVNKVHKGELDLNDVEKYMENRNK